MSMIYCTGCNNNIDTDFNAEHFIEGTETCDKQDVFNERAEIRINIIIDVGDERVLDTYEVGNGKYIDQVINEAIATLGKAERRYIPTSLSDQYEAEKALEDE